MANYVSGDAVSDMVKDAMVFSKHMSGVATLEGKDKKLYVILVTHPSQVANPIGIVFDYNEANDFALSIFQAAKQAKEYND